MDIRIEDHRNNIDRIKPYILNRQMLAFEEMDYEYHYPLNLAQEKEYRIERKKVYKSEGVSLSWKE